MMLDVAVIGGGAAGFFAAINIKKKNPLLKVIIYEKSKTLLGKVKISGGGRCNVTHACFNPDDLIKYYPRGKKELLGVFKRFNPTNTIEWFASQGVRLKTEADGRMFPSTDDSQTIIDCFLDNCRYLGVSIMTNHGVQEIKKEGEAFSLLINGETVRARQIVIATGSSEHFWQMLKKLGHQVVPPVPSLFTFNIKHPLLHDLMGVSLAKASVRLMLDREIIKSNRLKEEDMVQTGPLLVTHWGLSGPAILKLSSVAARLLNQVQYRFDIELNMSSQSFDNTYKTIQSNKLSNGRKLLLNTSMYNIPSRLWSRLLEISFERQNLTWADVSKKEMSLLAENLTRFRLAVNGKSTFKDEFVTAGGINLKEVDFKTMQSKLIPGLYFAGEVLDIDALTGGFNFQAAWSEAWVISEQQFNQD
jgi:predicted Rossmann fold flavoprotein